MSSVEKAVQTQIENIQKKTGHTLAELADIVRRSGLTKHSEIRAMLQREYELGYGDANALVHAVMKSDGSRAAEGKAIGDVLDVIYAGPKSALRPIHEKVMKQIVQLGDFEIAPKKGYVSLRRRKQFAMIGPATNSRVEVGLNAKDLKKSARLLEQPRGNMCNYIVKVSDASEVDQELFAWLKSAYESAG